MRNQEFTFSDFADIADAHGELHKRVSGVLLKLEKEEKIYVVGERKNKTGGQPTKIYQVTEGADFIVKSSAQRAREWQDRQKENHVNMRKNLVKIGHALDAMTARRFYVVGERKNKTGGQPTKIYQVTEVADFIVKSSAQRAREWQDRQKENHVNMRKNLVKIGHALDAMTARRLSA